MFIFKKSKIIVDCFITDEHILKYSPIEKANKFIPEWWKNTPLINKDENNHIYPTIKSCAGIIEHYKKGIIIPMWSDLSINIDKNQYTWQFSDGISSADVHNQTLWENFIDFKLNVHIKLHSPWFLKTKEDIHWVCIEPFWNNIIKNNYMTVPGTLSFKHQHTTNISLMIPNNISQFNIEHGHPMYHLIPLTEKELIIKHHLVTEKEINQYKVRNITFSNTYYKRIGLDIKNDTKKCPFHFK